MKNYTPEMNLSSIIVLFALLTAGASILVGLGWIIVRLARWWERRIVDRIVEQCRREIGTGVTRVPLAKIKSLPPDGPSNRD
jgi:hypothetical protein